MHPPVAEDLARLDRHDAVRRYSDLRNLAVLYVTSVVLILESIASIFIWYETKETLIALMAPLLFGFAIFVVHFARQLRRSKADRNPLGEWETRLFEHTERHLRGAIMLVFLSSVALATVSWALHPDDDPLAVMILIVMALRITVSERLVIHLVLLLAIFGVSASVPQAGLRSDELSRWVAPLVYGLISLVSFLIGWLVTRRFVANFLASWEPERRRIDEESRMREEIDLARTIQLSMLPKRIPEPKGLSIAARSKPASEVGGDFYDFYEHDGAFAVAAADVAGHGVGSGIVLSGVRAGLRLLSEHLDRLPEVMSKLEVLIRETRSRRMLVTLGLLAISENRRSAIVTSAGHPPLLHWKSGTGQVDEILLPSLPLGSGFTQDFEKRTLSLATGDRLLVHTDGAYETRNEQGEEFGLDRLAETLADGPVGESPEETLVRISTALDEFRGGAPQQDDVTLITVRVS